MHTGWRSRWRCTPLTLVIAGALLLLAIGNLQFFRVAAQAFPLADNAAFLVSLGVLLFCVHALLLLLFSHRWLLRPILILLLLVGVVSGYFCERTGTVIDADMLVNVLQTNVAEASDLMTPALGMRVLLLVGLPGVLISLTTLTPQPLRRAAKTRLLALLLILLTIGGTLLAFNARYATFFREYKHIRYYSNPVTPVYSLIKVLQQKSRSELGPHRTLLAHARIPSGDTHRELLILVVGETARADHFSLYGYGRPTNPVLAAVDDLHVYREVTSCGTATAVSVPCMFSNLGRAGYDERLASNQDNLLDVLQRAGVTVLWRDNNGGSKGVADRVSYIDYTRPENNPQCDLECRDPGMLDGLQEFIDRQNGDVLIVLHQMGSHGPAYYRRVPKDYEVFQPVCRSNDLSTCSKDEIINAYDNSIRYTDAFLGQVITLLKANAGAWEAGMLYLSDHGESLGEHGIYLHGMPYAFAPREQTHVPMLLWVGDNEDIDELSLKTDLATPTSHDHLWSIVLNYFEVEAGPDTPGSTASDQE